MMLFPRRLVVSLVFVVTLTVLGVIGFVSLEHESLLDALLTTVSAISTVGYSPPHPLSSAGKLLAIVLIMGGLFGIALAISVMTEYFMEGHLAGAWEQRRMDRAIAQLNNHYIISGFGRVGREVARTFSEARVPFVVVDVNEQALGAARAAGYLCMPEDASQDDTLAKAGIGRAQGLIACADSDTSNVYITLTARSMSADILIVARAGNQDAERKLMKAGASRVVSPYIMAGRQMAELAARPLLADHLNLLFDGKEIDVGIQELVVDGQSELAGRQIKELHEDVLGGAFVLALDRDNDRLQHVKGHEVVRLGDRLLVVGSGEQLRKLATIK